MNIEYENNLFQDMKVFVGLLFGQSVGQSCIRPSYKLSSFLFLIAAEPMMKLLWRKMYQPSGEQGVFFIQFG